MSFKIGQRVKIIGRPWNGYFGKIIEIFPNWMFPHLVRLKNPPINIAGFNNTCHYGEGELELVIALGEQLEFAFMTESI